MSTLSNNQIVVEYIVKTSDVQNIKSEFDKLTEAEKRSVSETKKLNDQVKQVGSQSGQIKGLSNEFFNLNNVVKSGAGLIAGYFTVTAIKNFTQEVLTVTAKYQQFQKVLDFTAGSQEQGRISMEFLRNTANKLGISIDALVSGYKTLSGAASQAGISNLKQRKIFEDVSKAVAAFGLSGEDAKGVYLALGQIISKGTVQAEELRGQIGERIPGAFAIAAKSMGVTEQELNKLLQTGKVLSKDFIVPFAAELAKVSENAGEQGLTQKISILGNAFELLKTRIGRGLLGPTGQLGNLLEKALNAANKLLETQTDKDIAAKSAAFEKAAKDAEKSSNQALAVAIQNQKIKVKMLDDEFNAKNELFTIDGEISDEETQQLLLLSERYEKADAFLKGLIAAQKDRVAGDSQAVKMTKEEYDARLKLLDLLRQERLLQEAIDGNIGPGGKIGTDAAYFKAKLALQREAVKAGLDISKEEINVTKLQKQKAYLDLKQATQMEMMEPITAQKMVAEQVKKIEDEMLDNHKNMKLKQAYIDDESSKKAIQKEQDLINQRIQLREQAEKQIYNLVTDTVNGLFSIQQANLANELTSIQNAYAEKIRLAGDNKQMQVELQEQLAQKEKEIKLRQFRASQQQAIANAVFTAAPYIIQYTSGLPITAANLALTLTALAAQTGFILAQPVPEFAKGTRGKAHKGKAIVGEHGRELVIGESGQVYVTPGKPTLVDFKEKSHVLPNQITERYLGSMVANSTVPGKSGNEVLVRKLDSIEKTLAGLPITQLSMNEKGFEKYVRTPKRTTKVLNHKFGNQ